MPVLVAAPDKFRGTATAIEVATAMAGGAAAVGWEAEVVPLADGGEGLLDVCARFFPDLHRTTVCGPLGVPVAAAWRSRARTAVVESARASGLVLAGGPTANDPRAATSRGTGELLVAAARAVGAGGTVVVGLGGSASTDGGLGALEAVEAAGGLGGATVLAACDVDVAFAEAVHFAPQKGAGPGEVAELADRLARVAERYEGRYGVDVRALAGAGAAGGLGGALAVLGAELRSGYELVAEVVGLPAALAGADAVATGEGALDGSSFAGKVVGGVLAGAGSSGVPVLVVAGRVDPAAGARARAAGAAVVSLVERYGAARATGDTAACTADATAGWLSGADR